jgi:hypothetical protein
MERKASGGTAPAKISASAIGRKAAQAEAAATVHVGMSASGEVRTLFLSATTIRAVPPDHVGELGALFLETSLLEGGMEDLIWRISGLAPTKAAILMGTRVGASDMRKRLSRLIEQTSTKTSVRGFWSKACPLVKSAMEYRNKFAHGIAMDAGVSDTLYELNSEDAPVGDTYKVESLTLAQTKKERENAAEALDLMEKMRSAL